MIAITHTHAVRAVQREREDTSVTGSVLLAQFCCLSGVIAVGVTEV